MKRRSPSTRRGCSENRANQMESCCLAQVSSLKAKASLLTAKERQSNPLWQSATVEFQALVARPPNSESPAKLLSRRSPVSAYTRAASRCRHRRDPRFRIVYRVAFRTTENGSPPRLSDVLPCLLIA